MKKKQFSIHESHSTIYSAPMGLAHMMCNTSPPWPFQILSDSELNCLYNVTSSLYHMISSLVSNSSISIQKSTERYKCFLTDFHVLLYRNHTRDVTKGKKVSQHALLMIKTKWDSSMVCFSIEVSVMFMCFTLFIVYYALLSLRHDSNTSMLLDQSKLQRQSI